MDYLIPSVYLIGEPKCGTTSIYEMLTQHPKVFKSEMKEPRYFASDLIKEGEEFHEKNGGKRFFRKYFKVKSLLDYQNLYSSKRKDDIAIDASVCYAYSTSAISNILKKQPSAKFIYVVRNPVDFYPSLYYQKFPEQEHLDINDAWKVSNDRERGREEIPTTAPYPSTLFYKKRVLFSKNLTRVLNQTQNVLIISFEKFKQDNIAVIQKIHTWLGLNTKKTRIEPIKTNTRTYKNNSLFHNIVRDPVLWKPMKKLLPERIYSTFRDVYVKLSRSAKAQELEGSVLHELQVTAKQEQRKIKKLINVRNLDYIGEINWEEEYS